MPKNREPKDYRKKKADPDQLIGDWGREKFARTVALSETGRKVIKQPQKDARVRVTRGLFKGKCGMVLAYGNGWTLVRMDDPEISPMTVTDLAAIEPE